MKSGSANTTARRRTYLCVMLLLLALALSPAKDLAAEQKGSMLPGTIRTIAPQAPLAPPQIDPPPGGACTPDRAPIVSVMATPKRGLLAPPDTVVGRGTTVQLRARAWIEQTLADCSTTFSPLPNPRWTMTFQPLGSDVVSDATPQLGDSQALVTSFTAANLGTYRATFQVDPLPNTTVRPARILIEVANTPIGWVNLGPDGTLPSGRLTSTGRINALASTLQGSALYAGSALGGVWKTSDSGGSWSPMSDNKTLFPLAIGALALAPDGTIYAGTGDPYGGIRGTGVYLSTDGGITWARPNPTPCQLPELQPSGTVYRIVIDPSNPSFVYMAGDAGVMRLDPFTGCWSTLLPPSIRARTTDIALDPSDSSGETLYAAIPGQGVLRTTNARSGTPAAWSEYLDGRGDVLQLAGPPSDLIKLAVASNATVYAAFGQGQSTPSSTDRLQVWRMRPGVTGGAVRGTLIDTSRYRDQLGRSQDQFGRPYGRISCWGNPCSYNLTLAVNPFNPNDIFLGTVPIWRGSTSDGGATWSWTDISGPTENVPGGGIHGDVHDLLLTGAPARLYLTAADDGGVFRSNLSRPAGQQISWTPLNAGLAVSQFYTLATAPGRTGALAGGFQDNASQQRARGRQWQVIPGAGGDGGWVAYGTADPSLIFYNPNTAFGSQIRSTQSPDDDVGMASAFWTDPLQPDALLGVNGGQLYISYDASGSGAATWSCIDPTPGDPTDGVWRIAVSRDPATRSSYWVGMDNGKIYRVAAPTQTAVSTCTGALPTLQPIFDPSTGTTPTVTKIDDIAEDPFTPCVVYAVADVAGPSANQWRVIRLANTANSCTQPMIAQPIAGVMGVDAAPLPTVGQDLRIIADPAIPGTIYIGGDRGLFIGQVQHNGSWHWQIAGDFPATRVTSLQVRQNAQQVTGGVFVATFGRGVWQRVYSESQPPVALSTPSEGEGLTVDRCEASVLDEHPDGVGRLALVDAEYTNNAPPFAIRIHPDVAVQDHDQPYFAREVQTLDTGHGSAQLLLMYAAADAPLDTHSDGLHLNFLDPNGQIFRQESCDFDATWLRADAAHLRVEGSLHQHEGGEAPLRVPVSVGVGNAAADMQTAEVRTTPFELVVAKGSRVTLTTRAAVPEGDFGGWYLDEQPTGRTDLIMVMDANHVVQTHFIEPDEEEQRVYLPLISRSP